MWSTGAAGVIESGELSRLAWVRHGFGTKRSENWPGPSDRVVSLRQTHSATIWTVETAEGCLGEGDALVTDHSGILLTIRTADCVPILLADPVRKVVGAIHAGWRGSASGIAKSTVEKMVREFGSRAGDLVAAIGPSIGPCCFEVGPEVAREFPRTAKGHYVDLWEENRFQLEQAGVRRIALAERCTVCEQEWFHSYRKEKTDGRMIAAIGIPA